MKPTFNLPQYKVVYYRLSPETGYYTKTEIQPDKIPVMRLPYELKITPAQAENIKCNATELIVSRDRYKNRSYKFMTGIQKTSFKNWYLGNDYQMINGGKVISIILFRFSADNSRLIVYYFSHFDKGKTDQRLCFANDTIPHLLTATLV